MFSLPRFEGIHPNVFHRIKIKKSNLAYDCKLL